jgi:hypothetical protein
VYHQRCCLKEDSNIYLRGFDIVKKSRDDRVGGRIAILINNQIKYTKNIGMYDCNGKVKICATGIFFGQERVKNCVEGKHIH